MTQPRTIATTALAVALIAPAALPASAQDPGHVQVHVDGAVVYTSPAPTLAEALESAGIEVSEHDVVSHQLSAPVHGGFEVTIERGRRELVVEEGVLHHSTVEEEDPDLPRGEREVRTKGRDGMVRSVLYVTSVAGEEVGRDHLVSVRVPPVDEVVAVGTKEPAPEPEPEPEPAPRLSRSTVRTAPSPTRPDQPQQHRQRAAAPSGSHSAASSQHIAAQMVSARGWGQDQFRCLVTLWDRESNWNHTAQNRSSGAYGIPQSLPGEKMASHGADWRTNPATQIAWGLDYIAGRYGTPCAALDHSYARGWY